jgi:hypothetical protein
MRQRTRLVTLLMRQRDILALDTRGKWDIVPEKEKASAKK